VFGVFTRLRGPKPATAGEGPAEARGRAVFGVRLLARSAHWMGGRRAANAHKHQIALPTFVFVLILKGLFPFSIKFALFCAVF